MTSTFRFELGARLHDTITGFEGTVTARAEYAYGSVMYCLEYLDENGRPVEAWFTSGRLRRCMK